MGHKESEYSESKSLEEYLKEPDQLPPDVQRQLALEDEMRELTARRSQQRTRDAVSVGREDRTAGGGSIVSRSITPVALGLTEWLKGVFSGRAGRHPVAAAYLVRLDADVAAFIAVRACISGASQTRTFTAVAQAIAKQVEDEVRFAEFAENNAKLYGYICDRVKDEHHRRRVLIHAANHGGHDAWEPWSVTDRHHIGAKLVELVATHTGMVEWVRVVRGKNDAPYLLRATDTCREWMQTVDAACELVSPITAPMVCKPRPWTGPLGGGYLTGITPNNPLPLVKTSSRRYLEELNGEGPALAPVLKAVNAMQDTPWRVNAGVYRTMEALWAQGSEVGKLPRREDYAIPPSPFARDHKVTTDADKAQLKTWKRTAALVHEKNAKVAGRRHQMAALMWLAGKFLEEEAIYFPHQLDFRGRIYAVPGTLNPQGSDHAKALLTFAEGKALGSEEAVHWLAIHGANVWGEDKLTLEGRVQWVMDNTDMILACGMDPLGTTDQWCKADKPWQFLAFCFEWLGYNIEGLGYKSHLPVALDGSCNGLQHFSAMLRDPVGGAAVNLTPQELPADIYQEVANVVVAALRLEVSANGSDAEMAQQWLDFGIDRSTTKRPVMVLPYGGTRYSCSAYIDEYIQDKLEKGEADPFGDSRRRAAGYLAGIVWDSIGQVVVAARAAMAWLQKVGREATKAGVPLVWQTPSGFWVMQYYRDSEERRIKTKLGATVIKPSYHDFKDQLAPKKQVAAVSPNFVHSMDASAMVFAVNLATEDGVGAFAMIHDSYGTHACDTPTLAIALREGFVTMYQDNDVLEQLRCHVLAAAPAADLPPVPPTGTLDLEAVLESAFFFA